MINVCDVFADCSKIFLEDQADGMLEQLGPRTVGYSLRRRRPVVVVVGRRVSELHVEERAISWRRARALPVPH